ncbi:hypothetical protein DRH29_03300 [candidate division Kazan bacterium]|uniref:Uncharacterized protein n=1 Tax=candidate division Kazan bacterium TaxID=2202143 RepID=A0A420ZCF0_UNCK3|nr:MAG: hypothetical protein DRH29_03300 [candidate division Kazan bacterium]
MAIKRGLVKEWEGVKFQNFPLDEEKETAGSKIWIFGGRYFSLFGHWAGVSYTGRYRFHSPRVSIKEIMGKTWNLRKMKEKVLIINAKGEKKEIEREYFCLAEAENPEPRFYACFIGGYYKRTLRGIGRDRSYRQFVEGEAEVLATTENSCRSGRYGNYASFIISENPLKIESEGVE